MSVAADATPRARVLRSDRGSRVAAPVMMAVVLVLALWVPYNVSLGMLSDLVGLFVLVILGTTWNLLAGYGGMVSIGQQAFVGAGGYLTVFLGNRLGLPLGALLLLAAVLGALLALPTSFATFRLVGGYFAIGTWVVAEVFKLLTTQVEALGGGSGLSLTMFRGVDRVERIALVYWTALVAAVAVILLTYALMRSPLGLALTAIRDDGVAASSLGVEVQRVRRTVYVVAAAGAGLAGGLIAVSSLSVTPTSAFSVAWTAAMIFIVVIGGLGTIEGPVLGAVVYFGLQQWLAPYGTWYLVALGVVAVVAVLALPKGLWGLLSRGGRVQVFPVGYRLDA